MQELTPEQALAMQDARYLEMANQLLNVACDARQVADALWQFNTTDEIDAIDRLIYLLSRPSITPVSLPTAQSTR